MKACLHFDLKDDEDHNDFELMLKSQDWKEAFQAVWKYVRDQLEYYSEAHTKEWAETVATVKEKITEIATEYDVEVW